MIVTPWQLSRQAELYHQVGSMISAGVPLIQALEMSVRNPGTKGSRHVVEKLITHLQSGLTFTDSMIRVKGWLPDFDIALLSVGEQSGRLDISFHQLSEYYEARAKIIRDTLAGLAMTLITLHVFLLIFPLGLFVSMVQGLINSNFAQCIPFLIQKAIVFGGGYAVVFFLIFSSQGNRGEYWRSVVEGVMMRIPILRTARRYLVLARLSTALEALVSGGVNIVQAWKLAGRASGSPGLNRSISTWKAQLEAGVTPAELVNRTRYFPEMFANLYSTGETSGRLDDTLTRLRDYFREEGFRKLRLFTRVLNGVIYGTVAVMVAIQVIRFYLAYFNAMLEQF
jgi:Type II secretory pathway, component PulF